MNKILLLVVLLLFSCENYEDKLENALEISGQNRPELEKVLTHYSQNESDSLKLRAAKFLIENMPGHYTSSGTYINEYIRQIDSLNPNLPFWVKPYLYQLPIENEPVAEKDRIYDIHNVTAKYLIDHIDYKFKIREIVSWRDEIDFDIFCEYILPYRSYTEPLNIIDSNVHNNIISRLSKEIQKGQYEDSRMIDIRGNVTEKIFKNESRNVICPPYYNVNTTNCFIFSSTFVEKMNCVCIPSMMDFVPFWANGNSNHAWMNHIDKYAVCLTLGEGNRTGTSKIYRNTFSHNPAPENDGNFIPKLFTPFIKDVTSEYLKTADIEVKYDRSVKNGYLAIFNALEWRPIVWSDVKKGSAKFKHLGKENVYLPIYYDKDKMQYADFPFILDMDGNMEKLVPNKDKLQKMHLTRKYTLQPYKFHWTDIDSLIILASNDSSFEKHDTVGTFIENLSTPYWELIPNIKKDFRYWKLVRPDNQLISVAELLFIDTNEKRSPLIIKHIPADSMRYLDQIMKIQDDNQESYATLENNTIIDIGKSSDISSIKIFPRNDGNNIFPNNIYELLYFDKKGWVSVDIKIANDYFIEFNDVPSKAIYWLRNHTKGKEERIFTYENEKARFW